jgi:hypothetical protein
MSDEKFIIKSLRLGEEFMHLVIEYFITKYESEYLELMNEIYKITKFYFDPFERNPIALENRGSPKDIYQALKKAIVFMRGKIKEFNTEDEEFQ